MRKGSATIVAGLMIAFFHGISFSQNPEAVKSDPDLSFNIEAVEKKPYSLDADIETSETIRFLNQDALLFKQKYLDTDPGDTLWQTDVDLTLEARAEAADFKFYGRFIGLFYHHEDEKWASETKFEESYITFQPSFSWSVDAGKKVHKWGKGYAFSPAAFFSRPKDLDDPDATLEGYYTVSIDYIKSMTGLIRTLAVTPVIMPVTREFNAEIGPENEIAWGGKVYFFFCDTDVDILFLVSDNLDNRIGIDFSKNLTPSFEIHGDAAMVEDYRQYTLDSSGNVHEQEETRFNFLLGLRYLSSRDTTYILEYYHNGQGYSDQAYETYLAFIESGYTQYLNTSSNALISRSRPVAAYYTQPAAMKDYLYLKITQKDPFDILYFVPAVAVVYNVQDKSGSITPQITYSPVTNLSLDLKTGFLFGDRKSEYGEKINTAKVVFSIRYFF